MTHADFTELQKVLGGVTYPADKRRLVEQARDNNAGTDILAILGDIPDHQYDGPDEVRKAVTA